MSKEYFMPSTIEEDQLVSSIDYFSELKPDNFLEAVNLRITDFIEDNSQGILKEMSLEHFATKGKMLRPLFAKELALSLGLDLRRVLDWATSCEILHNATLVHDDLQDGDEVRRGEPTIWKKYGDVQAINVGDFLLLIAPSPIIKSEQNNLAKLLNLFIKMSAKVVEGQANEFELNTCRLQDKFVSEYLKCIGGKTSTLFAGLARGVTEIANLSKEDKIAIESLFFNLGNLFQIQDDILDLYGDKQRGEIGCDIKEGKISFLIAKHLDDNSEDKEFIFKILLKKRHQTTLEDICDIQTLFDKKGTLTAVLLELKELSEKILTDDYLKKNKELKLLIHKFVAKVLDPINHLLVKQ